MKRFLSAVVLMLGAAVFMVLNLASPAFAGDVVAGKAIFGANCAACHMGGGNVINSTKTLRQADLEANGKDTLEAVIAQVTKGKAAMPAFLGKLSPEGIEDVASYVLDQAQKGW